MSNEPRWTPAPWNIDVCADGAPPAIGAKDPKDNMYFWLASIWGEDVDTVETEMSLANAKLIAKAPEMASVIAWALAVFSPDTPEHAAIMEAMHRLMNEARGES